MFFPTYEIKMNSHKDAGILFSSTEVNTKPNYYNNDRFNNGNARNRNILGLLKIRKCKILFC